MGKQAKIDIIIDNNEAKRSIDQLIKDMSKLKSQRDEAFKIGEMSAFRKFDKELKNTEKEMNAFFRKSIDIENVLKNINKVSTDDLTKAFRKARVELNATARDAENYGQKKEVFTKLKNEVDKVTGGLKNQGSFLSRAGDGFNKYFGLATAAIASFTGVFLGLKQTITDYNDYQKKVASLSSLTGLKGDELDWISKKAKEMSTMTTESGIIITNSADKIVDAFKKMGSARPELLGNKEALAAVTKEALILSEAAELDLDSSINAVAAAMNSFDMQATESSRVINVFAAGALAGNVEVVDLTKSMKNVGAVAKDSNMSLEQSVALLEILGKSDIKGEEAGTKLRGAMLKLKEAGVGYASGQFVMRDALVEVNQMLEKHSSAQEKDALKIKMFGAENVTVGTILTNNIEKYDELTKAVTGTNTAYDQAKTNTDTNAARLEQQKNKIKLISIELGEKLAPIMASSLGVFTKFMQLIIASINFYARHSQGINMVVAALAAYVVVVKAQELYTKLSTASKLKDMIVDKAQMVLLNARIIATQLLAAAKALLTGNINGAAKAMKILNSSMSGGIWGIVAAAVVALGVALYQLATAETNAQKAMKDLTDVEATARKEVYKQQEALASLLAVAANETKSKQERAAAIKKINAISPEYLGNLTLENIKTDESKKALERYNEVLLKTARIKAAKAKLDELENEQIDLETKGTGTETKWYQDLINYVTSGGNYITYIANEGESVGENFKKKAAELEVRRKALMDLINKSKDEGGVDVDPDEITKTAEEIAAEEEAKAKKGEKNKEWSLNADKEFNKAKLALQKQRLNDEIKTDEELNEKILQLEIKTLQDRLKLTTLSAKERSELEQQLVDKQLTAKNNQIKKEADAEKARLDAQKKLIEDTAKNNEKALNDLKIKNNEEFASITSLEQAKSLLKDSMSADELKKITNLYDAKQALRKKYDKEEQQLAITQTEALLAIYENIAKNGMIGPMGALSPEQIQELQGTIDKLKSQISEMKASANVGEKSDEKEKDKSKDLPTAKVDILGFTPENWQTLYDNIAQGKLLTEDWHETLSAGINMAGNSMIDIWKSYGEIVSKTDQKELNRFIKNQDSKKKSLSKRLEQGRISQESYNATVEAMDSELERRKAISDRNAAKRERDIALMSAIVNTASAMVSSLKTDPTGILAAAIGIMGGIQIKKIMATPLPELPGAETGGNIMDVIRSQDGKKFRAKNDPAKRGFVTSPTIITGENGNEYIMPDEALRNPSIRNMIDFIETARLNGSLSRINLPMIQQIAGRETGGFASSTKSTSELRTETTIYREQTAQLNEFTEVMKQVRDVLSKPIEAKTYLRGPRGIYEAMKEDETLKNNAKK